MMFDTLAVGADTEWLMAGSTTVRAHRHAAGARGGGETKPRDAVGAASPPRSARRATVAATRRAPPSPRGRQAPDRERALTLTENMEAEAAPADKGHDANRTVEAVESMGAIVVVPPRPDRKTLREYDVVLHRERNRIGRTFRKLKHFGRVATRHDKAALGAMAFLDLAAICLWLK
jgi:transposase